MTIFLKTIMASLAITLCSTAIASGMTTATTDMNTQSLIVFQVIQNQLVIDSSMIESASIVYPTNSSDLYGIELKLKNTAANELERISGENIGKQMNMVSDGVVVSSPTIQGKLGAEFQMYGLTKEQAERFIKSVGLPNEIKGSD